jgi:NAD dependent epimerase/dehydratase
MTDMDISGKTVLVTGADGFIGSHLTELLVARGANVRALALYNSSNDWGWLEDTGCLERVEVVCGDVRDPNFCRTIVRDVELVFHLAALIAIPYSYVAPDSYVATNITGTLNMLQASRDAGVKKFLHTSTSEVYGTARYVPINEAHPLQAQSPYSATKIAADALAMSFFFAFGFPVTVVRPFNTYGPRQSARAVIPTIITQVLAGKSSIRLGSLHPTRDFNFVEDTCRGFVALAECDAAIGETVNIGSNREISVGELAGMIGEVMQARIAIESDDERKRPPESEVERLWCDNTRIQQLTSFKPEVGLRDGLTRTVEWLRKPNNFRKYKAHIYNV